MGRRQPKLRQDHRNAAQGPKKMVLQLYTPHEGQAQVHACTARFRAVVCGRRWGKALALDTPLPTPSGWTTMGEVLVGDSLFDENGTVCRVVATTQVQLGNPCREVVFDDGTRIVADDDHLWETWDKLTRKSLVRFPLSSTHRPACRTTKQISDSLLYPRKDGRIEHNHSIPTCAPLHLPKAELLVHPYVLGVWLGDGCSYHSSITIGDHDAAATVANLRACGVTVGRRRGNRVYTIGAVPMKQGKDGRIVSCGSLRSKLKSLLVLRNKHIPSVYLRASEEQRRDLLRGLMDTDGYIEGGRHAEIIQVNERLARGIVDLVRSLGMKPTVATERATLDGRDCGPRFRISFTPDSQVFRLARKADSWHPMNSHLTVTGHRRIVSADPVPSVPVRCIIVDSPSHLFLAGDGMVPTHNSLLGVNELAAYSWEHPELPSWWVAPTYNQAAKGFTVCCDQLEAAIESKRQAPGQMSIAWKSGGRSRFVSTERYENLRGEGVGLMILDEAAFMPRSAWEQVLRPMLSDTMGRALFATTPKGKNWLYGIYRRGIEVDSEGNKVYPDYESFSFPTVTSPYIAASEVEEARLTLPADVFNQEYLAEFLDEAAGVFYGIQDCVFGELYEPNANNSTHGHRYVIGWDIAKHTDFSVIIVIDLDAMRDGIPTPHVCYFERFNQLRYDLQMDRVAFVSAMYGGAPVLLDSTGIGDPIYDSLSARTPPVPVFPYVLGNSASKVRLIQNLSVSIQSKAISYPKIPILISELESYQYTITPAGSFSYSAPEGDHDDTVISLALATWIAQHQTWMPPARFVVEDTEIISPI